MTETTKVSKFVTKETIILFWVSLTCQAILVLWIILKLLGIIHSPLWQEMIPYTAIAIPIVVGIIGYRRTLQKAETNIDGILKRLDRMDGRFDKIDSKFEKIDEKFERMDKKLEMISQELKEFRHDFKLHLVRDHAIQC